jgi:hypothetical protein
MKPSNYSKEQFGSDVRIDNPLYVRFRTFIRRIDKTNWYLAYNCLVSSFSLFAMVL